MNINFNKNSNKKEINKRFEESKQRGILNLYNCNLDELPELPKTLKILNCGKNNLTYLPEQLPPNLLIRHQL